MENVYKGVDQVKKLFKKNKQRIEQLFQSNLKLKDTKDNLEKEIKVVDVDVVISEYQDTSTSTFYCIILQKVARYVHSREYPSFPRNNGRH